jgi:hypothetical protein
MGLGWPTGGPHGRPPGGLSINKGVRNISENEIPRIQKYGVREVVTLGVISGFLGSSEEA